MTDAVGARFIRLAKVANLPTAHVLAARLDAEGIEVRVHGESQGPYPMTVGEFAQAELWVLSDRVDEARTILLDAEVNDALAPVDVEGDPGDAGADGIDLRWVAVVVLVILVALVILRFAALAQRL